MSTEKRNVWISGAILGLLAMCLVGIHNLGDKMSKQMERVDFHPQVVEIGVKPGVKLTITQQYEQRNISPQEFGAWCIQQAKSFERGYQ